VRYRKGPYLARDGDFAAAGAIDLDYVRKLDASLVAVEVGAFGHLRGLHATSCTVGGGDLLLALEGRHDDGPWEVPDDYDRINGVVRWTRGDEAGGVAVTAMGYDGSWTATDHVARRAVQGGLIGRFGSLDPTSGGDSSRYSLHVGAWSGDDRGAVRVAAWGLAYDFDLFSNFTYFLDDPIDGDQIQQTDRRWVFGLEGERQWFAKLFDRPMENALGVQLRSDFISNGLHDSVRRVRTGTVRRDDIEEYLLSAWGENRVQWWPKARTVLGLRADALLLEVDSDTAANSGSRDDVLVSPKAGVVVGPFAETELYVNGGFGFHSNDARGATLRDDPTTPAPGDGDRVDPLVRSKGAEVGVRTAVASGLHATVAAFALESDSELLFVGDAGNTEPARGSRRYGLECCTTWSPLEWLVFDADASWTHARFRGDAPEGDHIPGAVESVVAAAMTFRRDRWFASLRTRYFGPRPLIEDDSVRLRVAWLVNLRLGAKLSEQTTATLDVLNLLDEKDSDIEYYYPSRFMGEPPGPDVGGYADVHFHPVEPFTLRLGVQTRF